MEDQPAMELAQLSPTVTTVKCLELPVQRSLLRYAFFRRKIGLVFRIRNGRVVLEAYSSDQLQGQRVAAQRRESRSAAPRPSIADLSETTTPIIVEKVAMEPDYDLDGEVSHSLSLLKTSDDASATMTEAVEAVVVPDTDFQAPFVAQGSNLDYSGVPLSVADSEGGMHNYDSVQVVSARPVTYEVTKSESTPSPFDIAPPPAAVQPSNPFASAQPSAVDPAPAPKPPDLKIFVESEFLFGHSMKKLVKVSSSGLTIPSLIHDIVEQCKLEISPAELLLSYHDADLDEFVVLEDGSFDEFLKLSKKVVQLLTRAPPPPSPQASTDSEQQEKQIDYDLPPGPPPESPSMSFPLSLGDHPAAPASPRHTITSSGSFRQHVTLPPMVHDHSLTARAPSRPRRPSLRGIATEWVCTDTPVEEGFLIFLHDAADGLETAHDSRTCTAIETWSIADDLPPVGCYVYAINDVVVDDLDRDWQLMLIKQQSRPIIIDFDVRERGEETDTPDLSSININNSLFISKYSHSHASKLRKQVDKLLQDYIECDWALAKREKTGLPQATIISLYKYIESELDRLEFFNPKRSRGVGAPEEMTEAHWRSIKAHIEAMVFKRVAAFTRGMWPIFQEKDESDPRVVNPFRVDPDAPLWINHKLELPSAVKSVYDVILDSVPPIDQDSEDDGPKRFIRVELAKDHPLSMRMAFLRFVTLGHLGVHSALLQTEKVVPTKSNLVELFQEIDNANGISQNEEWYQCIRSMRNLHRLDTPADMMAHMKRVVDLVSRALEKYLCRHPASIPGVASTYQGLVCRRCRSQIHVRDREDQLISVSGLSPLSSMDAAQRASLDCVHALQCHCSSPPTAKQAEQFIAGDELIPAIIWTIMQANPPDIECCIWLCSEFRHPALAVGEEAYSLANVCSAVEFCKIVAGSSLEMDSGLYSACVVRYAVSLRLMLACKQGDLIAAQELVQQGADINALSPDQLDSPLTACVRFGQHALLDYLLSLPGIDVNRRVHLYRGPHERSTVLMMATLYQHVGMVVSLLQAGADRSLMDDDGSTALSLARHPDMPPLLSIVLLADTERFDVLDVFLRPSLSWSRRDQEDRVAGLLLQGAQVDFVDSDSLLFSPLIVAVLEQQVSFVQMLFSLPADQCADSNLRNHVGETALLVCVAHCISTPSVALLQIAALLLRASADRYATDQHGQSAVSLVEALNVNEKGDVIHPILKSSTAAIRCAALSAYQERRLKQPTSEMSEEQPIQQQQTTTTMSEDESKVVSILWRAQLDSNDSATKTENVNEDDPFDGKNISTSANGGPSDTVILTALRTMLLLDPQSTASACHPGMTICKPIYEYARNSDLASVRALLLQGVDINQSCPNKGYTALIAAIYNRDLPLLHLLVHSAAIHYFTDHQHPRWFTTFKDSFATEDNPGRLPSIPNAVDMNKPGRAGMTALHYAAQSGAPELVGFLLHYGATRDVVNDKSHTPHDVAVANGHVEAANVLRFDPDKVSISLAAKHGDWLVLRALLCQGISINMQKSHVHASRGVQHELHTPLIAAAAYGQHDLVHRLLSDLPLPELQHTFGCEVVDVNLPNTLGQTPLMFAAARGDEDIVLKLLKHGANRYAKDHKQSDAAHWAESHGHSSVSCILCHDPALLFVHDLIRQDVFPAVVAMLKQGVDVNLQRWSYVVTPSLASETLMDHMPNALQSTVANRRPSGATLLSSLSPFSSSNNNNNNSNNNTSNNSNNGNNNSVSGSAPHTSSSLSSDGGLLHRSNSSNNNNHNNNNNNGNNNNGNSINNNNNASAAATAASVLAEGAVRSGKKGTDLLPGETPLIVAARYRRMEVLQLLARAPGLEVDAADDNGWTALFHAAEQGHEDVVLFLLKQLRVSRTVEDCLGRTAMNIAQDMKHDIIAGIIEADPLLVYIHDVCMLGDMLLTVGLLKQGCPPTFRDERANKCMQTPLMAAATGGQREVIRMLLRYPAVQASIDDMDNKGRTALMRAAAVGALDVTAVLLNAGADRTVRDHEGLTARDHAARHSFSVLFQFMSQSMVR